MAPDGAIFFFYTIHTIEAKIYELRIIAIMLTKDIL